jgi:hypothetical protein
MRHGHPGRRQPPGRAPRSPQGGGALPGARRRTRPAAGEEQFATATALIGQRDHAFALEIIQPGLLRHPASTTLARLSRTALHRLMAQYQQLDPFKFLIYAELADAEIGPVE